MMNFAYRFLITMAFLGPNIYQITRRGIFQSIRWNGVVAFQSMAPKCSSSTRTQNYASNHHQYQPLALALHKHHLSTTATVSSSFTQLFMSSDDENDNAETIPTRTSFNITILKKETVRLQLRTHKKIGKVSTRIRSAEEQYDKFRAAIDASESSSSVSEEEEDKLLQQLEQAPDIQTFKTDLKVLQDRLQKLNWLEEQFNKAPLKSKKQVSVDDLEELYTDGSQVVQYIIELDISDDESQKLKNIEENAKNRRAKKQKDALNKEQGKQVQGGRLPYRRYYSESQTEIRVGKQATDNDVLSLSPEHRSGSHWWYHASGCPGSHVVLCTDAQSPDEQDILDAASLAALKSKCINQSVIKVSMTRARNVSKPRGAKPGLVQLNGDVKTITVRKSEVEQRCKRLEETVVVN